MYRELLQILQLFLLLLPLLLILLLLSCCCCCCAGCCCYARAGLAVDAAVAVAAAFAAAANRCARLGKHGNLEINKSYAKHVHIISYNASKCTHTLQVSCARAGSCNTCTYFARTPACICAPMCMQHACKSMCMRVYA
jgi:hypothetical protein